MSIKVEWASSHVATSEILLLERVATPSFEPYMGAFTDTVTVNLKSETAGASFYYTVDGSVPNDASTEYSSDKGIVLGLDPEGKEASYVIRALASLPPGMGDSVVATSGKIIVQPQVEPPVIVPESAGPYTDSVEVTVTCATPGASIYYSTDGSGVLLSVQERESERILFIERHCKGDGERVCCLLVLLKSAQSLRKQGAYVRSWCERAQVSFGVGLGFSSLSNTCALRAYLPMQFVTSKLASFAVL